MAVEITREIASDDARLRARIAEVKKIWSAWVAPGAELNVVLIDTLRPQLRDPAVGTARDELRRGYEYALSTSGG